MPHKNGEIEGYKWSTECYEWSTECYKKSENSFITLTRVVQDRTQQKKNRDFDLKIKKLEVAV